MANQPPLVPRDSPLRTSPLRTIVWTRGAKVRVISVNWPEIARSEGFETGAVKELLATAVATAVRMHAGMRTP